MIQCNVYRTDVMLRDSREIVDDILGGLVWPDSDFRRKLQDGTATGIISVVSLMDGVVGWARTEPWTDTDGVRWDTLEAFVNERERGVGVGTLAAAALVPAYFSSTGTHVAVFAPQMMLLAHRVGLHPVMFKKEGTAWIRA